MTMYFVVFFFFKIVAWINLLCKFTIQTQIPGIKIDKLSNVLSLDKKGEDEVAQHDLLE
jgi:hypothetical protein